MVVPADARLEREPKSSILEQQLTRTDALEAHYARRLAQIDPNDSASLRALDEWKQKEADKIITWAVHQEMNREPKFRRISA